MTCTSTMQPLAFVVATDVRLLKERDDEERAHGVKRVYKRSRRRESSPALRSGCDRRFTSVTTSPIRHRAACGLNGQGDGRGTIR